MYFIILGGESVPTNKFEQPDSGALISQEQIDIIWVKQLWCKIKVILKCCNAELLDEAFTQKHLDKLNLTKKPATLIMLVTDNKNIWKLSCNLTMLMDN